MAEQEQEQVVNPEVVKVGGMQVIFDVDTGDHVDFVAIPNSESGCEILRSYMDGKMFNYELEVLHKDSTAVSFAYMDKNTGKIGTVLHELKD